MIEPCPAIGTLKSGERMRHVPAKGPLACATIIRNARCLPSRLRTTSWRSERKCLPSHLGSDDIRVDTNHSRWRLSTSDPGAERAGGEHSRKLLGVAQLLARQYPGVRRLEMFAREHPADGGEVWGNEAAGSNSGRRP